MSRESMGDLFSNSTLFFDHERIRHTRPMDHGLFKAPNLQIFNRKTPSQNRHINSIPPEIIQMIFWYYCGSEFGPASLSLVCRSWYTIAKGYPALWSSVVFQRRKSADPVSQTIGCPIVCRDWPHIRQILARTGTYDITLDLRLHDYIPTDQDHISSLLCRCQELRITFRNSSFYLDGFSSFMPHLESISLDITDKLRVEKFLNKIESGSPRMKSLSISGYFPTHLLHLPSLLERITHLELRSTTEVPSYSQSFFMGFQNLEELVLKHPRFTEIPSLKLPKLVSLHAWNLSLPVGPQHQFPVLKTLTLVGLWSSLPLISAPMLRDLILRDSSTSTDEAMLALRRATVHPLSLSTDFISEMYLPELLEMWPNLSELHLRGKYNVCIPGPKTVAALAGQDLAPPLCPSLRYFTVHFEQNRKDPMVTNQSIERLQTIVEARKIREVGGLQRVMCVWNFWEDTSWTGNKTSRKELEWANIL